MNEEQTLMERVIEQIKKDISNEDWMAIDALLCNIHPRLLESFLEEADEELS